MKKGDIIENKEKTSKHLFIKKAIMKRQSEIF